MCILHPPQDFTTLSNFPKTTAKLITYFKNFVKCFLALSTILQICQGFLKNFTKLDKLQNLVYEPL